MGLINDKDYCVYMHTNKHNSKVYIGITSQKPEDRWGNNGIKYFDKRKDGEYKQTVFARALKKYPDWEEDWEHTIIAEHLNQEEAVAMEIELIALYKSNCHRYKNPTYGYNMTDGGEGCVGMKHTEKAIEKMRGPRPNIIGDKNPNYGNGRAVVQMSLDGEYIAEYDTMNQAAIAVDAYISNISNACKGVVASANGFLWRFKDEYSPSENIQYVNHHCRQVIQLTMNGEYIAEYDSLLCAEIATGVDKDAIRQCCNGKSKFAGNFVWRDKGKYDPNETFSYKPKIREIVQLDMDGNFIAIYPQVKFATQATGIGSSHISSCCTGKRQSTGGFRWMYKDDYDKLTQQND